MSCSDSNVYQAIRSIFCGVVPVSSIGYIVGIAGLGAVAVTVRVRYHIRQYSPYHGAYPYRQFLCKIRYIGGFLASATAILC
jgi:hypothetical protein